MNKMLIEKPKSIPTKIPINNILTKKDLNIEKKALDQVETNKKQSKNTILNLTNKSENQDLNIYSKAQESSKAKIKINQFTNEKAKKIEEEKSTSQLLEENVTIDYKSIINNFNTFSVKLKSEFLFNSNESSNFDTIISKKDNHNPKYLSTVTKAFFDLIRSYEYKLIEKIEDVNSFKTKMNSIYNNNNLKEGMFEAFLQEQIEINSNLSKQLKEKALNTAQVNENKKNLIKKKNKKEIDDICASNIKLKNELDLASIRIQQTHIYEWQIRLTYLLGFLLGIFIVFFACII